MRQLTRREYEVIRTTEKVFGERIICHLKKGWRGVDRRILIYHYSKRKPSIAEFGEFINDFEKFLEKFGGMYHVDGYFVIHGEYDKKGFNLILNRLDSEVRKLVKIKSLKEEKMPEVKKTPPLSNKEKEMLIHKVGTRCCYPHCNETIALDVHHIIPRSEGGTSKENNLVVLCPTHHRMARDGTIPKQRLKLYSVARMKKKE